MRDKQEPLSALTRFDLSVVNMAVEWMFGVAIECKLERVHNAPVMIHLWLFAQEFEVLLLQQQVEAFFHAQIVRKG